MIEPTKILTLAEIRAVIADLDRQRSTPRGRRRRALFRLATCCGLRASEIAGLRMGDLRLDGDRPCIIVRPGISKSRRRGRRKGRVVPLTYDAGTLGPLADWYAVRVKHGVCEDDPYICSLRKDRRGLPLRREEVRRQFIACCRVLGPARCRTLTVHHGRHSCATHLLAAGVPLPNVRDMLGHSNIAVTSAYLHVAEQQPTREIFG